MHQSTKRERETRRSGEQITALRIASVCGAGRCFIATTADTAFVTGATSGRRHK